MPYIKQENRHLFDGSAPLIGETATCAGDLNYAISVIAHTYLKKKGLNYANVNEVIGALECCKLELYRAIAAPYEDTKVIENGPVGVISEFGKSIPAKDAPGQQKIF
jgi:hypothetical protein